MELLHLDHVTHLYGNLIALQDVSLTLSPGTVGLLGPNGAGKSTFLKILLGLITPTQGTGTFLGFDLRSSPITRRRLVGYMAEADGFVAGLRGEEYVTLAGELCGMSRKQASRRAHHLLSLLGLEEARYRKTEEYSLGMKQRIKLAQAMVHDPPLLLLDEPTSGLDPAGREAMLKLLTNIANQPGKSIILCTHILSDVERLCEETVILHQGKVLRAGKTKELSQRSDGHFRITVQGESNTLLEQLNKRGCTILESEAPRFRVATPTHFDPRQLYEVAHQTGSIITGITRDEEDLTTVFHRLLGETNSQLTKEPA